MPACGSKPKFPEFRDALDAMQHYDVLPWIFPTPSDARLMGVYAGERGRRNGEKYQIMTWRNRIWVVALPRNSETEFPASGNTTSRERYT